MVGRCRFGLEGEKVKGGPTFLETARARGKNEVKEEMYRLLHLATISVSRANLKKKFGCLGVQMEEGNVLNRPEELNQSQDGKTSYC